MGGRGGGFREGIIVQWGTISGYLFGVSCIRGNYSGVIAWGGNSLGGNLIGGNCPGAVVQWGILRGNCPGGKFPGGQLSGGRLSRVK